MGKIKFNFRTSSRGDARSRGDLDLGLPLRLNTIRRLRKPFDAAAFAADEQVGPGIGPIEIEERATRAIE